MPRALKPCGTKAAHQRHLYHGERPCEKCRLAHNAAVAEYSRRSGRSLARQRAMAKLRDANPRLFRTLYDEAKQEEFDSSGKGRVRAYQAALRELSRELSDDFAELFEVEQVALEAEAWEAVECSDG